MIACFRIGVAGNGATTVPFAQVWPGVNINSVTIPCCRLTLYSIDNTKNMIISNNSHGDWFTMMVATMAIFLLITLIRGDKRGCVSQDGVHGDAHECTDDLTTYIPVTPFGSFLYYRIHGHVIVAHLSALGPFVRNLHLWGHTFLTRS